MICPKCDEFMEFDGKELFYCPKCHKFLVKGFDLVYYEQVVNVRRVIRCDHKPKEKEGSK